MAPGIENFGQSGSPENKKESNESKEGGEDKEGEKALREMEIEGLEAVGFDLSQEACSLTDKTHKIETVKSIGIAEDALDELFDRVEETFDDDMSEKEKKEAKLNAIKKQCDYLEDRLEKADKTTVEAKLCKHHLHKFALEGEELKKELGKTAGPKNKAISEQSKEGSHKVKA